MPTDPLAPPVRQRLAPVGFTVVVDGRSPRFLFHGTHPSAPRSLVTFARHDQGCAVLMGRLHYRGALRRALADQGEADLATAAEMVVAAYRHCGRAGIERLEGDFSLVLWDARSNLLVAARDPLGGYPLFWTMNDRRVAFGTLLAPLRPFVPGGGLDTNYLAEYLMRPALAIQERRAEETVYAGIQRVVPGILLEACLATLTVKRHRYWDWLDRMVDPGPLPFEAVADAFGERFRDAVRERIHGCTASHLSGGMDSTAVALVARDNLLSGAGEPPLHALSLIYRQLGTLAPETSYIEAALQEQPGIVAHRIAADALLAYDSFSDPPSHDEPHPGLFDLAKDREMIAVASAAGAETVLTGLGGDSLLDVPPYHLAALLRAGRPWAAWKEAARWAMANNTSTWRYFSRLGLTDLVPLPLRAGVGAWARRGAVSWDRQGEGTIAPWIRHDFARAHGLFDRGLRNLRSFYRACRPVGLSLAIASIDGLVGDCRCWPMAAPRGIVVSHPFGDPRLVALGLGIQLRLRQDPHTQKPLFAHAMRDVLPARIRRRRGKAHFNEVYYRGLARNLLQLEALAADAAVADLGLFDAPVLLSCLRHAASGAPVPAAAMMQLDLALGLIQWLSAAPLRDGVAHVPAHIIDVAAPTPAGASLP